MSPFDVFNLSQILHDAGEVVVRLCCMGFTRGPNLSHDGIIRHPWRVCALFSVLISHDRSRGL